MPISMKLTNEAFRLKLGYGAAEPESLSSICAARCDKVAFQMIVNADRHYCLASDCAEWYSSVHRSHRIGATLRLRAAGESPFESKVSIEEFGAIGDGIALNTKAINDAKNEISGLAMAIAGKVVGRELNEADQSNLIDSFIDELGDGV